MSWCRSHADAVFCHTASQVSCNVSIAGSEAAGGRWWQLHCSTVPTATTNQPAQDYLLHSSGNSPTGPMVSSPHSSTSSEPSKMQLPKTPEPQPPDPPEPQPPDPDDPDPSSGDSPGYAKCGPAVQGPMLVVVLERVQSGLLGAALSAFGITGLYFSVVFGEWCQDQVGNQSLLNCGSATCVLLIRM